MRERKISTRDANLILSDDKRFPTIGSDCNASCCFYFCCANSEDYGKCQGFIMMNGESARLLKRTLDNNVLEYIQNSYVTAQHALTNGNMETVECVTRDIHQLEELSKQTEKRFTLRGMDIFEIEPDGSLSIPEPKEPELRLPEHRTFRNVDLKEKE